MAHGQGAVAIGGLAFCYIASAPILLLHTMRAKIPRTPATYKSVLAAIVVTAVLALIALWRIDPKVQSPGESVLLLVPFGVVVMAQISLLLYGIWRKAAQSVVPGPQPSPAIAPHIEQVTNFYVDLASRRAKAFKRPDNTPTATARAEYVESYRHLREHGNAVLILVAEAILALALLYSTAFVTAVLIIVLWVLPATIVWPMATWLEASLDSAHA